MGTRKFYNQQAGISKNVAGFRIPAMLFLAFTLLFGAPAIGQTYYNVTALSGPFLAGGVSGSVSSTGDAGTAVLGCEPMSPYLVGSTTGGTTGWGSYTWSFSTPVSSVRVDIDAFQGGDTITAMINGVAYFINLTDVTAYGAACIYGGATFTSSVDGMIYSGSNASGTLTITTGSPISSFTLSAFGNTSGLLSDFEFAPIDNAPSFVNGSTQSVAVCQAGGTYDITALLAINDIDTGQTETWTIVSGPTNGTLGGFPYSATSTGATLTPAGLTYTPTGVGSDAFTIMVDDGNGGTATTTVNVTINPTPGLTIVPSDTSLCNSTLYSVTFSGTVSGETFNWTNDNTFTGLSASGSGSTLSFTTNNINSMPVTGNVTIMDSANGCGGTPQTYTITVYPTPGMTTPRDTSLCNGVAYTVNFDSTVAGETYSWTNTNTNIGLAGSGSGNTFTFTSTNDTNQIIHATISITPMANGCSGPVVSYAIAVNPTPYMMGIPDQTHCNGFPTSAVTFADTVDGTTYTWTNSNINIGLAASGSGNISSFTATDTTTAPISGSIVVTPMANGCFGPTQSFNILVNPTPLLSGSVSRYSVCDSTVFIDTLKSATVGTSITWSRSVVSGIRNGAGSGFNTISEALVDTTVDTVVVTYVATLSANSCVNTQNINVTVSPLPMLSSAPVIPTVCDGAPVTYIPLSLTSPVYFSWVRDSVAGISPGSNVGSPNISETLTNHTTLPVIVTYAYTLEAYGCTNTQSVTVTVNPNPVLSSSTTPPAVCDSSLFHYIGLSSTPGTTITWSRDSVGGISNSSSTGIDSVNEYLVNTTTGPVSVTYIDTLNYNGCKNTEAVTVSVNPKPMLSSPVIAGTICDNTLFTYAPNSASTGFTSSWSRALVPGITNSAASGVDTIRETLVNITDTQIVVVYMDTLKVNGCVNVEPVMDTVNPKPTLSSTLDTAFCDSAVVNYFPMSKTSHTQFAWVRPFVSGIVEPANSSSISPNPNEQLINTTNFNVIDTYVYTLTFDGCSNVQKVAVTIRPTPLLISNHTESVCSGAPFVYGPASGTPSTTFAWTRGRVVGIKPNSASGADTIRETLTDSLTTPVQTVYDFTLSINGCTHKDAMDLTVNPAPTPASITLAPPNSMCNGTYFQNFGTTAATSGIHYRWTATGAEVFAEGANKQYALVNFDHSGVANVILTTIFNTTSCANTTSTYSVTVGSNISENPEVIYYNGQFICMTNSDSLYQWGYDDAIELKPTVINGEINQVYFNSAPDLTYQNYWVMTTTKDGCFQKSYYNAPLGVSNVNALSGSEIRVYPNPAIDNINVEISTLIDGNVQVEILNLLGQKVATASMTDHNASISVAGLPSGCYLVDCYHDGVRLATSKFVKN